MSNDDPETPEDVLDGLIAALPDDHLGRVAYEKLQAVHDGALGALRKLRYKLGVAATEADRDCVMANYMDGRPMLHAIPLDEIADRLLAKIEEMK